MRKRSDPDRDQAGHISSMDADTQRQRTVNQSTILRQALTAIDDEDVEM